jgi:hypothetical protein
MKVNLISAASPQALSILNSMRPNNSLKRTGDAAAEARVVGDSA